jgi:hypothetical protein
MALTKNPSGSTEKTDNLGTFIAYNRRCSGCEIDLTSRNRSTTGSLICKPCGTARARIKYATTPRRLRTPQEEAIAAIKRDDPDRKYAHTLLEGFLNNPCNPEVRNRLLSKLNALETAAFMQRL